MTTRTNSPTRRSRTARTRGVAAALAQIPAIAPLGVAVGVALGAMSAAPLISWLSAPLMVAGASQLVLFTQIDDGASILAAALAAVLLNGRFVIYGAALANRFAADQPRWFRTIGPHYIVDQTYAMTLNDITATDGDDDFRSYFMAAGTLLLVAWTSAVGLGILVGPVLPSRIPLEFVLPASFVALITPTVTRASEILAVLVGAASVVVISAPSAIPVVAALGGAAVATIATANARES